MPFPNNGTLTTDKRTVDDQTTWSNQSQWEQYESLSNIEIVNGNLRLLEYNLPTNGLIHRYKFNDTSSAISAVDSAGSDNASMTNASYSTDSFEGSNSLSCSGNTEVSTNHIISESYSIVLSFKTLQNTADLVTTWKDGSPTGPIMGIGKDSVLGGDNGKLKFYFRYSNTNSTMIQTSNTYNDGTYHNACFVYDFDSSVSPQDRMKIYVDGTDVTTNLVASQGGGTDFADNNVDIAFNGREGIYYDGLLDDYIEYNRAISLSEYQDIYAPY